ncbi:MAG TPA: phosphopyruvate hydratase, partial [Candidatus Saccharimonadales bacterium]|nr:phosphopyruvate hydratase [Candidatus Saccharimonadales bacterium]
TELDRHMIELDGTPNKERLGANAILAVSLACAKAAAVSQKLPLWQYLRELAPGGPEPLLPMPMMNIINGGRHAAGSTDNQEFMIMPVGAGSFSEAVRMGSEIFHALGRALLEQNYSTTTGDEGGFAPSVQKGNAEALALITRAAEAAGYRVGQDVLLALDVAATELHEGQSYRLQVENQALATAEMIDWLAGLTKTYPIVSIEDGLSEDDWPGWVKLTEQLGAEIQLVGDDLLVTKTELLERGIKEKAASAILIKPNQVGTLTETIQAVQTAQRAGWRTIISHRSGETEDTSIAHLAVGLGAGQIKTGSLSRTDRTAKYNELMRIEEALGGQAQFAGRAAIKR